MLVPTDVSRLNSGRQNATAYLLKLVNALIYALKHLLTMVRNAKHND